MNHVEAPVAVVTGGAGGIGSAISLSLASAGYIVVITVASRLERAERLVTDLPGAGHFAMIASVESPEALQTLADAVASRYGRLDVLVNAAGITRPVPHDDLEGLDDELIDRIFRVNWRGAFAAIRALHPLIAEADGGVIVNISSIAGTTGNGSNVAYCASKAALDSMTRSLARALAPSVRILSVAPGVVSGEYADALPAEWLDAQRKATPLGRFASAGDVADAVMAALHLHATTGAVLPVDGGRSLGT